MSFDEHVEKRIVIQTYPKNFNMVFPSRKDAKI